MFILEKPYVSDILRNTLAKNQYPVLANDMTMNSLGHGLNVMDKESFKALLQAQEHPRLYSNSENSIDWISANLTSTNLPRQIGVFKDKAAFRRLSRPIYPEFWFQETTLSELPELSPESLRFPLVVKPSVGFFSLGVHVVNTPDEWQGAVSEILSETEAISRQYPLDVLNTEHFILEQCVHGREFAVDVYYNAQGGPVILNIIEHLFASEKDVSDRVYFTSSALMREWLPRMSDLLGEIGRLAGLRNFPAHVELRTSDDGSLQFIEVNPMRFAGWCVADMTQHAYGFSPYEYYMNDISPDWDSILPRYDHRCVAVVVADIPGTLDRSRITSVDYDGFAKRFRSPLEYRRIDFRDYSVFAFLFVETPIDDRSELETILGADLTSYLTFS